MILLGGFGVGMVEAEEALVDLGRPEDLGVGQSAYACDDGVGVGAGSVDQVGYSGDSELPDGGVGCEGSGATREFGVPVHLVAGVVVVVGEIGGVVGEGGAVGCAVGYEGVAGVVGDVEPFVTVDDPGVGGFDAFEEMAEARACGCPEAEGSVDVNPGVALFCERDERGEVVEGAEVEVAGLEDDDGGGCGFGFEGLFERLFGEAAVGVGGECGDVFFAEAEEANGAVNGAVFFGAGEDADGGGAGETVLLDVPVVAREKSVTRGCEAGGVCHLGSGDEGEAGGEGKVEELL